MADVIGALGKKRIALLNRRKSIEHEAQIRISEIDGQIKEVNKALAILNDAIKDYLCPRCGGSGNVRECDAAGQMEDCDCPVCHGTGIRPEED